MPPEQPERMPGSDAAARRPAADFRVPVQRDGSICPTSGVASVRAHSAPQPGTVSRSQRASSCTQEEREKRKKLVDLIRSRNPYRLSREGVLQLPGFAGIPLAGLTEFQATVRLQADPELRDFDVSLIRLPLKKIGTEALKPFGYDLFDRAPRRSRP